MKTLKKIALTLFILTIILFLCRGLLYRLSVNYESLAERDGYKVRDTALVNYINVNVSTKIPIDEIIELSLNLTSEKLNFTADKNSNDPNILIYTKNANCVGYASFCASTINHLLRQNSLDKSWRAKAHKGQLYFFGYNVHKLFSSPFFKDHDFVMITNNMTGEIRSIDPSIHDYLLINYVTTRD